MEGVMEAGIENYVARAKSDPAFFDRLVNHPDSVLEGFSAIETKVLSAIDGMSPDAAVKDLLASPSNDHCYRTSCGISSFIT
jgi:hypothetical protein